MRDFLFVLFDNVRMSNESLHTLIATLFGDGEVVPGSKLGKPLRDHFPDLVEKHGKLSTLIEREAQDLLIPIGKAGYDTLYKVSINNSAGNKSPLGVAEPNSSEGLWRLFCNPKERGCIWVRQIDNSLLCAKETFDDVAPAKELARLTRLTHSDVQAIIQDFYQSHLARSSQSNVPTFADQYWRDWTGHLRLLEQTSSIPGLVQMWWSFYQYKVELYFIERLRPHGFSSKDIDRSIKTLEASRMGFGVIRNQKMIAERRMENSQLRALAIATIEQLSDEDLQKLSLPIGAVSNVTSRTK